MQANMEESIGHQEKDPKQNPKNFEKAGELILQDNLGNKLPLKEIYKQKTTIFYFIRHFLCFVCRDHIQDIKKETLEKLKQNGIQLKIIGCGTVQGLNTFAEQANFDSREMYVNRLRDIYSELNLYMAKQFSDIKNKDGRKSKTNSCLGRLWQISSRVTRGEQGNIYQMGGTFVVGQKGEILFEYRDKYSNDAYDINELVEKDLPKLIQNWK